jgi:hypothetical protein
MCELPERSEESQRALGARAQRASGGRSAPQESLEQEVAAIVAAIELAWPRPVEAAAPVEASRWRFSGRPWRREDGWATRGA